MSYFRKTPYLNDVVSRFTKDQRWLIVINADPDAMASAMALRRIMARRGANADIASINEQGRPDNLAMIRYTRLHLLRFDPSMLERYNSFAMVDSQPSHSPKFDGIPFTLIVDHHPPVTPEAPGLMMEIKPDYGATSTLFTEYLYNLDIRPGQLLATALQFGIRTDTLSFQRNVGEVDLRAYQYLGKFASPSLLNRIMHSEFHLDWLPFFAKAETSLRKVKNGYFTFVGKVNSPDILVLIADFLTHVYEIRWVAVGGVYGEQNIVIFRSDGLSQDVGRLASLKFGSYGSAGGHKTMARAEFEMPHPPGGVEKFMLAVLKAPLPRGLKTGSDAAPGVTNATTPVVQAGV